MPRILPLVVALALLLSGPAVEALPFEGTLTIATGDFPFGVIAGSGEGVSTPAAVSLTSGGFLATLVEPRPPGTGFTRLTLGFPGGLAGGGWSAGGGPGGGFGGDAPLAGILRGRLFGPSGVSLTFPLGAVGVEGGVATASAIQIEGRGWTTGRLSFTALSPTLFSSGTDARTASGAGNLVLVTATTVRLLPGGSLVSGVFSRLDLHFGDTAPGVPEPGALALFGLGALLVGRASRRRAPDLEIPREAA